MWRHLNCSYAQRFCFFFSFFLFLAREVVHSCLHLRRTRLCRLAPDLSNHASLTFLMSVWLPVFPNIASTALVLWQHWSCARKRCTFTWLVGLKSCSWVR